VELGALQPRVWSRSANGTAQERPQASAPRRSLRLNIDVPLLLVMVTLLVFGLVILYSASYDFSYLNNDGDPNYVFVHQLIWLAIGLGVAVVMALVDYHFWKKLVLPIMLGTMGLLALVLFISEVRHGATRTLFSGSGQPSELAKLVTIMYLAVWLFNKRDKLTDITIGLIPLSVILGFMGGLILGQPDISAVLTIIFLGGWMFFLAGGDLRQIGLLLVVAMLVGWLVVQVNPTGSNRVNEYVTGLKNPLDASYHVQRSWESFVNGGWFGVGIGKGEKKLINLPFPSTDSVFAVVGEETGVFGSVLMVGLYSLFLWRGLSIARRAPDQLGSLLAAGLTTWICIEAFINMSMMINVLPFAGNALPFVSAGGSNLVASLAGVGLLMNINRQSEKKQQQEGRQFSAVVDLRRGDRRRGVSSPRRPTSPPVER